MGATQPLGEPCWAASTLTEIWSPEPDALEYRMERDRCRFWKLGTADRGQGDSQASVIVFDQHAESKA